MQAQTGPKTSHTGQGVAVPPQLVVPWLVQWATEQGPLTHAPPCDLGLLHQGWNSVENLLSTVGPDSSMIMGSPPAGPHFSLCSAPYNSTVGPECGSQCGTCVHPMYIHMEKQDYPGDTKCLGMPGVGIRRMHTDLNQDGEQNPRHWFSFQVSVLPWDLFTHL